jgi:hypothetical protein
MSTESYRSYGYIDCYDLLLTAKEVQRPHFEQRGMLWHCQENGIFLSNSLRQLFTLSQAFGNYLISNLLSKIPKGHLK